MIHEQGLRDTIVGIFKYIRTHEESLQMLMREVASLREVLQQASDGKFLPILEERRIDLAQRTDATASALIGRLDQAIQQLEPGGIF
jgi:hypothetical protein